MEILIICLHFLNGYFILLIFLFCFLIAWCMLTTDNILYHPQIIGTLQFMKIWLGTHDLLNVLLDTHLHFCIKHFARKCVWSRLVCRFFLQAKNQISHRFLIFRSRRIAWWWRRATVLFIWFSQRKDWLQRFCAHRASALFLLLLLSSFLSLFIQSPTADQHFVFRCYVSSRVPYGHFSLIDRCCQFFILWCFPEHSFQQFVCN